MCEHGPVTGLSAFKRFYDEQVVPRAIDKVLGSKPLGKLRQRALAEVEGEVLEIGFGSGTNLPHYPDAITRIIAVEPSPVGRRLARRRLDATSIPVDFVGLVGESIPLDDASVDNAVSTWTLCSVQDVARVVAEVRRVLRPGGRLFFLEHGLSDDPRLADRQHRRNAMQQRLAGGCQLIHRHDELLRDAGFEPVECATFVIAGPKTMSQMYAGTARKPSGSATPAASAAGE